MSAVVGLVVLAVVLVSMMLFWGPSDSKAPDPAERDRTPTSEDGRRHFVTTRDDKAIVLPQVPTETSAETARRASENPRNADADQRRVDADPSASGAQVFWLADAEIERSRDESDPTESVWCHNAELEGNAPVFRCSTSKSKCDVLAKDVLAMQDLAPAPCFAFGAGIQGTNAISTECDAPSASPGGAAAPPDRGAVKSDGCVAFRTICHITNSGAQLSALHLEASQGAVGVIYSFKPDPLEVRPELLTSSDVLSAETNYLIAPQGVIDVDIGARVCESENRDAFLAIRPAKGLGGPSSEVRWKWPLTN